MAFPNPNVFKNQLKQNQVAKTAAASTVTPLTGGFAGLAKKVVNGATGLENQTIGRGRMVTASLASTLVGSICKIVGEDPRKFAPELRGQFDQGGANNHQQGPMFM